ncbi:ABC transporter substrate-binding protein [Paenibacillus macerans]|uniref:Bacterial extracellular solute-binding family protein n=1 Tax=Paenibacillus macerans TaxID=44252 RepID=A0A090ZVG1_PAEMA|nr:ABC transporter substrate-binding protein [Paenibacillus macerans]KFN08086.1 bacterial extracellular solute-binding family protein [Paenibacillus macerans]MCY7556812.1 ABC transporter substrate-binding protein [Paenibacillus macerans]MEC0152040.1 ABC transporter substrate-binding protein [Paenibacillus macerans]SUA84992.1 glycerol-3-phosphate ABC transporter substarate-binding protein [Paenibacillus macerans]
MQKWSTKVLAVALGLSLLAGCGGGNGSGGNGGSVSGANASTNGAGTANASAGKKTELTFYYPIAVGGPLTATIEAMAADFEAEHPDIDVTPVYTGSYADTAVKTQAGVQAKQPPDVAVQQSTELFSLLDMNAIIPLDDFIVKEEGGYLADFYPAFMANSQTDGHTYSIPFQRSTIVLYYNKEMFKEAGLDPEKGPETWEQMQEYAVKLKKDGRYGLEIPVTGFAYWMMQTFALQNGDNLMTPDGKKVMFDTPENVEGLQYWVDLAAKHKATPEGVTDWSTVPSDFLEGKTAMMYHTTGNLSNVKKNATFDFGVSFLPAKKQYGSPTGGGNFYIFKDIAPEKQQAAWEFVKFMTEPEHAAQWSIDTGYVAVRKSAYETERMKEYAAGFPAAVVARDQLEYAAAELSTHNNGKVMKILNDSVQAALIGDLTPAGALKKAQAEADQALASFNK